MTNQINAYTDERNPNPGRYIEAEALRMAAPVARCDTCRFAYRCPSANRAEFCNAWGAPDLQVNPATWQGVIA